MHLNSNHQAPTYIVIITEITFLLTYGTYYPGLGFEGYLVGYTIDF
jgi:hypothetical protein